MNAHQPTPCAEPRLSIANVRSQPEPREVWRLLNSQFRLRVKSIEDEVVSGELLDGKGTQIEIDILFLDSRVSDGPDTITEDDGSDELSAVLGGIND